MWKFSSSGEVYTHFTTLSTELCVAAAFWLSVFFCTFRYLEPPKVENDGMLHPYEELEAQLPSVLVEELHALTVHIGHLCELPSNVLAAFTIQNKAKVGVFL